MEISRNQFFMAGLVLFLLGIQFLQIDSVELKEQVATFIAQRNGQSLMSVSAEPALPAVPGLTPSRIIHPPEWLGWMLFSFGIVGILHSFAMPKSG